MSRPHTKRDESFRFLERGWSMECNMERNYAVIPACDPSDSFIRVVRDLNRKGFEILVVNDGSKPECRCIFDQIEPMAVVLTHPENRGKGEALKTAFRHLILAGAAGTVVTLDCDGSILSPILCILQRPLRLIRRLWFSVSAIFRKARRSEAVSETDSQA